MSGAKTKIICFVNSVVNKVKPNLQTFVKYAKVDLTPPKLSNFSEIKNKIPKIIQSVQRWRDFTVKKSDGENLSRKMVFPYTFTSKVAQFPIRLHWEHHWMFSWFFAAVVVVSPVFYFLQKAANSEANVKFWAEKRRKEEKRLRDKLISKNV